MCTDSYVHDAWRAVSYDSRRRTDCVSIHLSCGSGLCCLQVILDDDDRDGDKDDDKDEESEKMKKQ